MNNPDYFKKIADNYNSMSKYEQFCKRKEDDGSFENIDSHIKSAAERGSYTVGITMTFRYDDVDKDYYVKYYKTMGYKNVEIVKYGETYEID